MDILVWGWLLLVVGGIGFYFSVFSWGLLFMLLSDLKMCVVFEVEL